MYAVVRTGGKQYRVGAGDIVEIEKLDGDVGDEITLDDVLLVSNGEQITIGQPTVDGASVAAVITGQYRGPKVLSFRYRPKKRIRVRRGHRQYITRLEIQSIGLNGTTYSDAMELGPKPAVERLPKKRKKKGATTATFLPVADAASGLVDSAEDTLAEGADAVESAVDTGVDTLVETANAGVDVVSEATSDVVETANDAVESAANVVEDAAAGVVDAAGDAVEDVADAASDVVDDAANAASDAVDGK